MTKYVAKDVMDPEEFRQFSKIYRQNYLRAYEMVNQNKEIIRKAQLNVDWAVKIMDETKARMDEHGITLEE